MQPLFLTLLNFEDINIEFALENINHLEHYSRIVFGIENTFKYNKFVSGIVGLLYSSYLKRKFQSNLILISGDRSNSCY